MKIFRRKTTHSRKQSEAGSQSMVVNDANRDFINDSANMAHLVNNQGTELTYIELAKKNKNLSE